MGNTALRHAFREFLHCPETAVFQPAYPGLFQGLKHILRIGPKRI